MKKTIAQKIQELRIEKGLSTRKMAKLISISHTAYLKYEKGTSQIPLDMLEKIAAIHNISVAELYETDAVTLAQWKQQHTIDDLFYILNEQNKSIMMLKSLIESIMQFISSKKK